jgi:hypothetical protein
MEQFLSDSDDLWRDRPITRPMKGEIKLTQVEIKRLVFFLRQTVRIQQAPVIDACAVESLFRFYEFAQIV